MVFAAARRNADRLLDVRVIFRTFRSRWPVLAADFLPIAPRPLPRKDHRRLASGVEWPDDSGDGDMGTLADMRHGVVPWRNCLRKRAAPSGRPVRCAESGSASV